MESMNSTQALRSEELARPFCMQMARVAAIARRRAARRQQDRVENGLELSTWPDLSEFGHWKPVPWIEDISLVRTPDGHLALLNETTLERVTIPNEKNPYIKVKDCGRTVVAFRDESTEIPIEHYLKYQLLISVDGTYSVRWAHGHVLLSDWRLDHRDRELPYDKEFRLF